MGSHQPKTKRSRCLKTRVTPDQARFIKENARRHGLSISEWCGRVALGRPMPHPRPSIHIEAKHLLKDLDRRLETESVEEHERVRDLRSQICHLLLRLQTGSTVRSHLPPTSQRCVAERTVVKLYLTVKDATVLIGLAKKSAYTTAAYLRQTLLTAHVFEKGPALSTKTVVALSALRGTLRQHHQPSETSLRELGDILSLARAELEGG